MSLLSQSRSNPTSISIDQSTSPSTTPRKPKTSQESNQESNLLSSSASSSSNSTSFKASVLSRVNPAFLSSSDSHSSSPPNQRSMLGSSMRSNGLDSPSFRGNVPLPIPSRSSSVASPIPTTSSFPTRTSSIVNPDQSASSLADSIADLHLNDSSFSTEGDNSIINHSLNNTISFENQSQEEMDLEELNELLNEIVNHCHDLESEIFLIQEKRHSSIGLQKNQSSKSKENESDSDTTKVQNEQDLAYMKISQKIEQCSKKMNHLETGLRKLESQEEIGNEGEDSFSERTSSNRNRRNSLTSLSSFDEEFQPNSSEPKDVKSIRKKFEETSIKWLEIQNQSTTLEQELIDDKKDESFNANCSQIQDMLNSLKKGLMAGNEFNSSFGRFKIRKADDEGFREEFGNRLDEFTKLKGSIETKRAYYTPAIEQMFGVLERNLKGRITSNGTMLKRHSDLKTDWRFVKENFNKVVKEMASLERRYLSGAGGEEEDDDQRNRSYDSSLSPARNHLPLQTSGTPNRPALRPKHSSRNLGSGSSAPVSPASTSSNLNSPPPKPPKSLRRTSMAMNDNNLSSVATNSSPSVARTLRSKMSSSNFNPGSSLPSSNAGGPFARHGRSASTSAYQQPLSSSMRSSNPPISSSNRSSSSTRPAWNNSIKVERDRDGLIDRDRHSSNYYNNPDNSFESIGSNSSSNSNSNRRPSFNESTPSGRSTPNASFAPSSYRNPSMLGTERPGIVLNNGSRISSRSKTPQPQPTWTNSRTGSEPPIPFQNPARERGGSTRPPSRTESRINQHSNPPIINRPASSAGHYYSGEHITNSRPVSIIGNYYHPPQSSHENPIENEKSPRKRDSMIPRLAFPSSHTDQQHQHHPQQQQSPQRPGSSLSQSSNILINGPPISSSRYNGASRLSMQTPEPMIAARVNRMNMYAKPSGKTSSKPPMSQSSRLNNHSNNSNVTSPLIIKKTNNGRTTPLNAAALEKIPNAGPVSIGGNPSSISGSSVANFRAQRASSNNNMRDQFGGVGGSGREGAITPNYSEGGSSIGGFSNSTFNHLRNHGGNLGGGHGYGNGLEFYKPNPNDNLDVEVSKIVNELGARCERIDLPLPRGQKLQLGPGKSAQARYEIAGKKVACRMLELHRPAGSAGSQAGVNTRKISVRVGGGYQDLKLWLYDRMSAA